MDEDLETLSRDQLIGEIKKLRNAIRGHRDASGHDLCWHAAAFGQKGIVTESWGILSLPARQVRELLAEEDKLVDG